jgi:hypothetical protein
MPIMLWLFIDTIERTHDLRKLCVRLAAFAVAAQFAFNYYISGHIVFFDGFNVLFTFLVVLLIEKADYFFRAKWLRYTIVAVFCLLSLRFVSLFDWGPMAIIAGVYMSRHNNYAGKARGILLFFLVHAAYYFAYGADLRFTITAVAAAPVCLLILWRYDRDLPVKKTFLSKYFFYILYPLQFVIIKLISDVI